MFRLTFNDNNIFEDAHKIILLMMTMINYLPSENVL